MSEVWHSTHFYLKHILTSPLVPVNSKLHIYYWVDPSLYFQYFYDLASWKKICFYTLTLSLPVITTPFSFVFNHFKHSHFISYLRMFWIISNSHWCQTSYLVCLLMWDLILLSFMTFTVISLAGFWFPRLGRGEETVAIFFFLCRPDWFNLFPFPFLFFSFWKCWLLAFLLRFLKLRLLKIFRIQFIKYMDIDRVMTQIIDNNSDK